MWRGLGRFTVASLRWTGPSSVAAVLFTILVAAPVEHLIRAIVYRHSLGEVFVTWTASAVALRPWSARFTASRHAWFAPLGAAQVQFSAIWGLVRRLAGRGVAWKGRVLE